jgi:hypothetical protein
MITITEMRAIRVLTQSLLQLLLKEMVKETAMSLLLTWIIKYYMNFIMPVSGKNNGKLHPELSGI